MTMMEMVFQRVDKRIGDIEEQRKRAAVIIINDRVFRQIQQEMFMHDQMQKFGAIRSPYSLQSYKGAKVVTSEVVELVEVF